MITEAIAVVAATGGLATIPVGQRVVRRRQHRACLRSIATLERQLGITVEPPTPYEIAQHYADATSKWVEGFRQAKQANHDARVRNAGYVAGRANAANAGAARRRQY